jgi:hypothetical protein
LEAMLKCSPGLQPLPLGTAPTMSPQETMPVTWSLLPPQACRRGVHMGLQLCLVTVSTRLLQEKLEKPDSDSTLGQWHSKERIPQM